MFRFIAASSVLLIALSVVVAQEAEPAWVLPTDAKFVAEDVSIPRAVKTDDGEAAFKIAGTLRLPTTEKPEAGFPSVLFVSGSGSQTRHGIQGKLDLGTWEVLDAIANAGFAVLATDDRGVGKTPLGHEGMKTADLGYLDLVEDAQACLDYLLSRDETNNTEVFLVGHSEGGLTVPILAGDNPEIAGVITMAGAGRNMYDVTLQQVKDSMKSQPKAAQEANIKVQMEFQNAVKEGREPDFNILGAAAASNIKQAWKTSVLPIKQWWHDHFNLDVPAIHAKVACPVFVAQGEADFQVSPKDDAKLIVKDLMAGECSDVTLKIYADLDHLFKPCGGKKSEMKMYFTDRRVNAEFIEDVVRWLTKRSA
ncbi:alpha/beta fold hydrolase [Planctomycetota bacterium]|nr:alpha/beta fold hydrolase [Planctomycetota bacterium]